MPDSRRRSGLRTDFHTLALLLGRGVPLARSLTLLEHSTLDPSLREALPDICKEIEAGSELSATFANREEIFDSFVTSMVRAGEVGGIVHLAVERIAEYADHVARLPDPAPDSPACEMLELSLWARRLGVMLGAGVPVLQAMEVTAMGTDLDSLREATLFARQGVREGKRIAVALGEHPATFSPLIEQLFAVGEVTGTLDSIAVQVADDLERRAERVLIEGDQLASPLERSHEQRTDEPAGASPATDSGAIQPAAEAILEQAVRLGASDIHIEPDRDMVGRVRFRVDGVLRPGDAVPADSYRALTDSCKRLAHLDVAQRVLPQEGHAVLSVADTTHHFRVSTMTTVYGEWVSIRRVSSDDLAPTFADLGWEGPQQQTVERLLHQPCGILCVAGPPGSGRTTTLYALLEHLNSTEKSVVTCEDALERELDGIQQSVFDPKIGDRAEMLRALSRHDPDVIMVTEVRDSETLNALIQLALGGHLVLTGITATNAADAAQRLHRLAAEPLLLTDALVGIIAQRLLRKVCAHCGEALPPDSPLTAGLQIGTADGTKLNLRTGKGCERCGGTGCKGRTAAFEILEPRSQRVRRWIGQTPDTAHFEALVREEGFSSISTAIKAKVAHGIVSPAEASRVLAAAEQ